MTAKGWERLRRAIWVAAGLTYLFGILALPGDYEVERVWLDLWGRFVDVRSIAAYFCLSAMPAISIFGCMIVYFVIGSPGSDEPDHQYYVFNLGGVIFFLLSAIFMLLSACVSTKFLPSGISMLISGVLVMALVLTPKE